MNETVAPPIRPLASAPRGSEQELNRSKLKERLAMTRMGHPAQRIVAALRGIRVDVRTRPPDQRTQMTRLTGFIAAPLRLSVALPLILGWATTAAAPTAEAATNVDQVDIIDGQVDVTENGSVTSWDDATDVLLFFDDATPIRVDIIDGRVDVTENGSVNAWDDLPNADVNDMSDTFFEVVPTSNQVDIIDGLVDVNEDGGTCVRDDATDIRLVRLWSPPPIEQVDIIDGLVDVTENGSITTYDDATDLLLAFSDAALIRADIIDGVVHVKGKGDVPPDCWSFELLTDVDLNDLNTLYPSRNQVDIIYFEPECVPHVDVNEDGWILTDDDAADVRLVKVAGWQLLVSVIDGSIDVDYDGVITYSDDLYGVLLLFDDAAPIRVDIIDGQVDVTEGGFGYHSDDLPNVDLGWDAGPCWPEYVDQVDIIDGLLDENEDGFIGDDDNLGPPPYVTLLVP